MSKAVKCTQGSSVLAVSTMVGDAFRARGHHRTVLQPGRGHHSLETFGGYDARFQENVNVTDSEGIYEDVVFPDPEYSKVEISVKASGNEIGYDRVW